MPQKSVFVLFLAFVPLRLMAQPDLKIDYISADAGLHAVVYSGAQLDK